MFLKNLASNRLDRLEQREQLKSTPPKDIYEWLYLFCGFDRSVGFADYHKEFWQWVETLEPTKQSRPFLAIWPRGGGKTSSAEATVLRLGLEGKKKFFLYVRSTQEKANESVSSIASLLESKNIEYYYPEHSEKLVGKYGQSKKWTMKTIRTAGGLSVVGMGLDSAVRGAKLDTDRPDFIILDDIDEQSDSELIISKKLSTITKSIIPAGAKVCDFAFVQNLIHTKSIMKRLVDGVVSFFMNKIISGPHPAIKDLSYDLRTNEVTGQREFIIKKGTATWAGLSLEICQDKMNSEGDKAFLQERQHDVGANEGTLIKQYEIDATRVVKMPDLVKIAIGVDPGVTASGDGQGIIACGLGVDGHLYIFDDVSIDNAPPDVRSAAVIACYNKHKADIIVAETNNGGDYIENSLRAIQKDFGYRVVHATRGKRTRAEPMTIRLQNGTAHIVGFLPALEKELTEWKVGDDSPNRLDAAVWGCTYLNIGIEIKSGVA